MGRDRDADHEVSGREGDRDANFTQPRRRNGCGSTKIYIICISRRFMTRASCRDSPRGCDINFSYGDHAPRLGKI